MTITLLSRKLNLPRTTLISRLQAWGIPHTGKLTKAQLARVRRLSKTIKPGRPIGSKDSYRRTRNNT